MSGLGEDGKADYFFYLLLLLLLYTIIDKIDPEQAQAVQQNDTVLRAFHEEALRRLRQTEDQLQQQRIENVLIGARDEYLFN